MHAGIVCAVQYIYTIILVIVLTYFFHSLLSHDACELSAGVDNEVKSRKPFQYTMQFNFKSSKYIQSIFTHMLETDSTLKHEYSSEMQLSYQLTLTKLALFVVSGCKHRGVFTCSFSLFRFWKSVLTESDKTSLLKFSCIFLSEKTLKTVRAAVLDSTSGFFSAHAWKAEWSMQILHH